jgi:hypothetical protein
VPNSRGQRGESAAFMFANRFLSWEKRFIPKSTLQANGMEWPHLLGGFDVI